MSEISRRKILSVGTAMGTATATTALAGTFGNPDEPAQGIENTSRQPRGAVDPGPQNQVLSSQFPKAFKPPATDVGDLPQFWSSFSLAPRRVQEGGWARQSPRRISKSPLQFLASTCASMQEESVSCIGIRPPNGAS